MSATSRCWRAVACVLVLLAVIGCEKLEPTPEERQAVEEAVQAYLDSLAKAYSTGDLSVLDGHATGSEKAAVRKLLTRLGTTGDRLQATLLRVEIERLQIFREVNATIRLMEVWDVGRFDAYSGVEKGRNPSSVQNSIIQMRLVDGRWLVTARQVLGTETGTRWTVVTPVPDTAEGGE